MAINVVLENKKMFASLRALAIYVAINVVLVKYFQIQKSKQCGQ